MSFNQAQQGTPLSTTGTNYTISAPTAHLTPAGANAVFASGMTAPPSGPMRNKSKPGAKTRPSKQLSKSLSTPQLRGPIMSDPEIDKKRNKLGYQRISIACAHCRRRKIRCLLAEEDPEGRCHNCIRLKKDCVFYPVDQQAAIDARSESSSKLSVAPSASSSTVPPSPIHGDARSFEQQHHSFGAAFPQLSSSVSSAGFQGIPIASSTPLQPQDHGYRPHPETPVSWAPQEFSPSDQTIPVCLPQNMSRQWPGYGTPHAAVDTAPFPGPSNQPQRNMQAVQPFNFAPEHVSQQWQNSQQHPPVRSMSVPGYGHPDFHPAFHSGQQPAEHHIRNVYDLQQAGTHMIPVSHPQPAYQGHPPPYVEQRSSSIPLVQQPYNPQLQQIPPGWYGHAPPYTQGEEPRPGQHHGQQGDYHIRPS